MKIVIDCNVIISAGLTNGICRRILKHIILHHDIILSEDIVLEYLQVIRREKFRKHQLYLEKIAVNLTEIATFITPKSVIKFSLPDQSDVKYLATALTSSANYLISGNIKDFPDIHYEDTTVINPREYEQKFT